MNMFKAVYSHATRCQSSTRDSVDAENCVYTYMIVQFGQFVFLISLYAITNIDFGNTV